MAKTATTGAALEAAGLRRHAAEIPSWDVDGHRLAREWTFKDFAQALRFVDRVGAEAERMGHHPDIHLTGFRNVRLELSTHVAGGVTLMDVELAGRIDRLGDGSGHEG